MGNGLDKVAGTEDADQILLRFVQHADLFGEKFHHYYAYAVSLSLVDRVNDRFLLRKRGTRRTKLADVKSIFSSVGFHPNPSSYGNSFPNSSATGAIISTPSSSPRHTQNQKNSSRSINQDPDRIRKNQLKYIQREITYLGSNTNPYNHMLEARSDMLERILVALRRAVKRREPFQEVKEEHRRAFVRSFFVKEVLEELPAQLPPAATTEVVASSDVPPDTPPTNTQPSAGSSAPVSLQISVPQPVSDAPFAVQPSPAASLAPSSTAANAPASSRGSPRASLVSASPPLTIPQPNGSDAPSGSSAPQPATKKKKVAKKFKKTEVLLVEEKFLEELTGLADLVPDDMLALQDFVIEYRRANAPPKENNPESAEQPALSNQSRNIDQDNSPSTAQRRSWRRAGPSLQAMFRDFGAQMERRISRALPRGYRRAPEENASAQNNTPPPVAPHDDEGAVIENIEFQADAEELEMMVDGGDSDLYRGDEEDDDDEDQTVPEEDEAQDEAETRILRDQFGVDPALGAFFSDGFGAISEEDRSIQAILEQSIIEHRAREAAAQINQSNNQPPVEDEKEPPAAAQSGDGSRPRAFAESAASVGDQPPAQIVDQLLTLQSDLQQSVSLPPSGDRVAAQGSTSQPQPPSQGTSAPPTGAASSSDAPATAASSGSQNAQPAPPSGIPGPWAPNQLPPPALPHFHQRRGLPFPIVSQQPPLSHSGRAVHPVFAPNVPPSAQNIAPRQASAELHSSRPREERTGPRSGVVNRGSPRSRNARHLGSFLPDDGSSNPVVSHPRIIQGLLSAHNSLMAAARGDEIEDESIRQILFQPLLSDNPPAVDPQSLAKCWREVHQARTRRRSSPSRYLLRWELGRGAVLETRPRIRQPMQTEPQRFTVEFEDAEDFEEEDNGDEKKDVESKKLNSFCQVSEIIRISDRKPYSENS